MALPKEARYLIKFALVVLALVVWRLLSPYNWSDLLGQEFVELWSQPYFYLGETPVTAAFLVKALVFVVLLMILTTYSGRFVRDHILVYTEMDKGAKFVAQRVVTYGVFAMGLIIGLQSAGLNLASLAVVGGAIGIGVGFGLQTIAKNLVSGLILLLEQPIKVGDRVQVESLLGDVVHIGARGTWIRTNENVVIIVPNAEFIEGRVTNWTANDRQVRIAIPLGVSYGSDPAEVREVLIDVARRHPDIQDHPQPDVIFVGFGESSLDFELRIWTTKQVQTPKIIASDLYFEIFRAFQDRSIEIPFPQRDLHLRSVSAPISFSSAAEKGPLRADGE